MEGQIEGQQNSREIFTTSVVIITGINCIIIGMLIAYLFELGSDTISLAAGFGIGLVLGIIEYGLIRIFPGS